MPDDRLQLPDSLEKAFDYAKQEPTDWELMKKRALTWEQVSAKGRRLQRWSRWWKPLAGVVAAAAVVLAAVVVPSHLPNDKGANNWSAASMPKSETGSDKRSQPAPNDTRALTDLYAQQGQQFVWHDASAGYDLVVSTQAKGNTQEVSLARNGFLYPIMPMPSDKKVQPIAGMYSTDPLIGFTFVDRHTEGFGALVEDTMYFINPDTMKVASIPVDGKKGFINQIGIWDQAPNKITLLFSQLNSNTGQEQVYSWVWPDQGTGEAKPLFATTDEVLKAIDTYAPAPVLFYPHHLYQVESDGSVHLIDSDAKLNFATAIGPDRMETNGLLYAVGSFPDPSFGSYTGDKQVRFYSFSTGASQVLLPGVEGDQEYLDNLGTKFLLQNFVADDPSQASTTLLKQVPGTLQIWYVEPGKTPMLVYKKHEVGETYLYRHIEASPREGHQTLLVEDPNVINPASALDFDWQTHTVQSVTLSPAK